MQSIDAPDEFTGGVVLVSHDSRLISRVCEDEEKSEIWVVEIGTVKTLPESFEEYKEELQREIKAEVDSWFGSAHVMSWYFKSHNALFLGSCCVCTQLDMSNKTDASLFIFLSQYLWWLVVSWHSMLCTKLEVTTMN